jgi:alanine racemase
MFNISYAQVDTSKIISNIRAIRSALPQKTKVLAVVKANGYGHGAVQVANAAIEAGAEYLGVAMPKEGIELRNAGIKTPILIFGGIRPQQADDVVEFGLSQAVYSDEILAALDESAKRLGKRAKIHIKIDTGMSRIGVRPGKELDALLSAIKACGNVDVEGMFTHFAVSEISDKSFTLLQARRFDEAINAVRQAGFRPVVHASNSGASLDMPQVSYDMVRLGIAMYGYYPGENSNRAIKLEPAMSWYTTVTYVKQIEKGDTVSYGRLFTASVPTRVATIAIGYGDGYKRNFTGKASVIIGGRRVPVIGRICMDQCMVDVSDIPDVKPGDRVTLIGKDGGEKIDAEELAGWIGTISYEILLSIMARVSRIYT